MSGNGRWMQSAMGGACGCGNRIHAGDDVFLPGGGARALCRSCAHEDVQCLPTPPTTSKRGVWREAHGEMCQHCLAAILPGAFFYLALSGDGHGGAHCRMCASYVHGVEWHPRDIPGTVFSSEKPEPAPPARDTGCRAKLIVHSNYPTRQRGGARLVSGTGAQFEVTAECVDVSAYHRFTVEAMKPGIAGNAPPGTSLHWLVADAHPDFRDSFCTVLESGGGVDPVANAPGGLLSASRPSIVEDDVTYSGGYMGGPQAQTLSISRGPAFDPEWNGLPPSIATPTVRKPDGSVLTKKPDGWTVWEVPATNGVIFSPPNDLALARAIFRSDPRVVEFVAHRSEAFLPGCPVAPQPGASATLERNMAKAWDRDEHGWKTEAEARAARILAAWGVP